MPRLSSERCAGSSLPDPECDAGWCRRSDLRQTGLNFGASGTIGIGAGPDCDGQVLVVNDLLGLTLARSAKFVRAYADLAGTMRDAFAQFRNDVRAGRYPDDRESYHWPTMLREQFDKVPS